MIKAIRIVPGSKITHDDWKNDQYFNLEDLIARSIPAIGIPAITNRFLIIDVDSQENDVHAHSGVEFWKKFAVENEIPPTYTVRTPNGGYHFYFYLPKEVDSALFKPIKQLSKGVDVVYRGYVQAPPTPGYEAINGSLLDVAEAPVTLMAAVVRKLSLVEDDDPFKDIHAPLNDVQIERLERSIQWVQANEGLTYHEWFQGLISLKAGVRDEETLERLALMWTQNQNYSSGDEDQALSILENATANGGIGPGTIIAMIREKMMQKGSPALVEELSQRDVIERSGVPVSINPKTGAILIPPTDTNIARICDVVPELSESRIYFDTRMDSYIMDGVQVDDQRIINRMITLLQSSHGLGFTNFSRAAIASALQLLMDHRRRDPHLEWLQTLEWDGTPRIDTFFPRYVGTEDNDYIRAVGKNLFISLAARGLNPGCKMDNVIILEGPEGIRKSSLVEVLAGKYYLSLSSDEKLNNVETLRKMHQSCIVEIPELVSLINRDAESIKAIITTKVDRVRDLFARKAYDRKRGFIMIGTTNESEYLNESMGYRRYWPIKITKHIDLDRIIIDRDQLYAEGVVRFKRAEEYWRVPKSFQEEIRQRQVIDPLTHAVEEAVMSQDNFMTVEEIFQVLKFRDLMSSGLDKNKRERITGILNRSKEMEKTRLRQKGQTPQYGWRFNRTRIVDDLI